MKNCSILKFIICLGLSFVATSCVVYHPHNVDIPLLQEQERISDRIHDLVMQVGVSANIAKNLAERFAAQQEDEPK